MPLHVWIHVYTQPKWFITWVELQDTWPNNQGEATEEAIARERADFEGQGGFEVEIVHRSILTKLNPEDYQEYQRLCKQSGKPSPYNATSPVATQKLPSNAPKSKMVGPKRAKRAGLSPVE